MAKPQLEIEGTESPGRIPELHAMGLELFDLQTKRMDLTKLEKAKRLEIQAFLEKRGETEYDCDGVHLWIEEVEKVKVKIGGAEDE